MVFHPPTPAESATERVPAKPVTAGQPVETPITESSLTSLPQALSSYGKNLLPLPLESIRTEQALNRCLGDSPRAVIDLPGFTQSAVDGYALLSIETSWASLSQPVRLRAISEIAAGPRKAELPPLASKMAYRILTGAPIPRGVDTVVPQEKVQVDKDFITLDAPIAEKCNIRYIGEELKKGDTIAAPGQRVSPGLLAALMAAGTHTIRAHRRPRVSVLVTGDEVVPSSQVPTEGQVHDANAPLICNWMATLGYPVPTVNYVKDVRLDVETALRSALDNSDLVITTGGVSVGSRDYIPEAAQACGVRKIFWKVAQKPGKPLFFGLRNTTPLLALPGNPAAVLVGLVIHTRRVLDCLEGVSTPGPRMSAGRLLQPVKADPLRDRLVRMNLSISAEGVVHLDPLPRQESHMLSNLATAMALVMLPARERPYDTNEPVLWTPLPGVTRI